MKKLSFVIIVLFSFNGFAETLCPQPNDLSSDNLSFYDWSMVEKDIREDGNDGTLFVAQTLFEVDSKVWSLTLGLMSEDRPRLQARRLLGKARPPTVTYDEDGDFSCVYLNNMDKKVPEFISVIPAPEFKPCPSLQLMKDTPFTQVEKSGDGSYITMADLEDRGTNWMLFSFSYKNEATAILETEELKHKAYKPEISEYCTYFIGITKQGVRAIIAAPKQEDGRIKMNIKRLMNKKFHQPGHVADVLPSM